MPKCLKCKTDPIKNIIYGGGRKEVILTCKCGQTMTTHGDKKKDLNSPCIIDVDKDG